MGERYTIADIGLYAYTHVAPEGGFCLDRYAAIRAWLERVAGQSGHVLITARPSGAGQRQQGRAAHRPRGDNRPVNEPPLQPRSEPPSDLTAPHDDGAAAHLPGAALPPLALPCSAGGELALSALPIRAVVFVHPSIGGIDAAQLDQWTAIPGARGCTPQACAFRDRLAEFAAAGVDVLGLSAQPAAAQRAAAQRLGLPYPLLSDERLELAAALGLPSFQFHGRWYLRRLTLVVSGGTIEAVLYPVFPPDRAAEQALAWLAENPGR